MPTFCRHNRLIQNCPICSREQHIDMRPVISSSEPKAGRSRASSSPGSGATPGSTGSGGGSTRSRGASSRAAAGVRVRRLDRGADDGYRSGLAPGLRSGEDAERLAAELAFAATRLARLGVDPPGLYATVADPGGDIEERSWLAFLIAYLGPLDSDDPFAAIRAARTTWASGEPPALEGAEIGPRGARDPGRGTRTVDAYRAWAARAGSQAAAFTGDASWGPERRFARVFERLALPGLDRGAKFDLLSTLGRLGVYDLHAGSLALGGSDSVTVAAKRVLGIGDPMLLERRASELADACEVPLEALDVGFYNWERGERAKLGLGLDQESDPALLDAARAGLGL